MFKKNTILGLLVSLAVINMYHSANSEEIPILKDVTVLATVVFNKNTKFYDYGYKIINPSKNTGQISNIEIDISKSANSMEYDSRDLVIQEGLDYEGKMMAKSFEEAVKDVSSRLHKELVPVGAQPPAGWSAGISALGTIGWGSEGKAHRIMPGGSAEGFKIGSKGLPSIRDISIRPKWVLVVKDSVSEEDLQKSKKIEEEITLHGKTIGPTAPPADFKPAAFLDYIIDLKHQAISLGWVKNEGAATSLDAKLDNAKKKISEGQPGAAKNILSAFINEVEAQGCATYENCPPGKHLTSEAYALLKYNAQYLIDNLK